MAINKIKYGEQTLIDLTSDTVDAEHLAQGYTAHDKSGSIVVGSMSGGYSIAVTGATPGSTVSATGSTNSYSAVADANGECSMTVADGDIYSITDGTHSTTIGVPSVFNARFLLPSEYTRVEYLIFDYLVSINTGVTGGDTAGYMIEFDQPSNKNTYAIFGGNTSNGLVRLVSAVKATYCDGKSASDTSYVSRISTVHQQWMVNEANEVSTNGGRTWNAKYSANAEGWGNKAWSVVGVSYSASTAKFNLYRLLMRKDGIVVRDYYPCYRNSDNQPGLYDMANGVFYTLASGLSVGPTVE